MRYLPNIQPPQVSHVLTLLSATHLIACQPLSLNSIVTPRNALAQNASKDHDAGFARFLKVLENLELELELRSSLESRKRYFRFKTDLNDSL